MSRQRKLYRDKFNGKIFGVCAGIAEYFAINSAWPRIFIVVLFFVGFGPLVLIPYVVMAMVLEKKPPHLYNDSIVRTFYDPEHELTRRK